MNHLERLRAMVTDDCDIDSPAWRALRWAVRVIEAAGKFPPPDDPLHWLACTCQLCEFRRLLAEGGE